MQSPVKSVYPYCEQAVRVPSPRPRREKDSCSAQNFRRLCVAKLANGLDFGWLMGSNDSHGVYVAVGRVHGAVSACIINRVISFKATYIEYNGFD
jgi:hypothetical protein